MDPGILDPRAPVLVLGASGPVGGFLLDRLLGAGAPVIAVSRRAPATSRSGLTWLQQDLRREPVAAQAGVMLSAGPLPLAASQVRRLPGLGRVVALGSASIHFKPDSPDPDEAGAIAALSTAEAELEQECARRGIGLTLIRPTLIYGGPENRNLQIFADLAGRTGWLPVAGNGRRHPVHAEDLAALMFRALCQGTTGTFDVGGGEVLAYRDMVRRVCRARGRDVRLVPVPAWLLRFTLRLARACGRMQSVRPVMIDRQSADLLVDDSAARGELDWQPRPFRP